jgi:hypothetical protein
VLPGPALELATYHRPEWEVTWTPAPVPSPKSAPPPTEHAPPAARSLLLRAALILVPLAALAAAIKWLVGCAVDYPVPEGDEPAGETVACTVFAPTAVAAGEAFLVQVLASSRGLPTEPRCHFSWQSRALRSTSPCSRWSGGAGPRPYSLGSQSQLGDRSAH